MRWFDLIIVPDQDDEEAALVFVEGLIEDHSYRFLLDTGAARTCVGLDSFTATFPGVAAGPSSGLFGGGSDDEFITVSRIDVGPITKTDFQIRRTSVVDQNIRNLIGMDLLVDLRCLFRFQEQRVEIDLLMKLDPAVVQPLFLDQVNHPFIDVHLGNATTRAVWDTGAGMTVVDLRVIEWHPEIFHPVGMSQGTDATGATQETPMYQMTGAIIGGNVFPPHSVAAVDFGPVNATIAAPMAMVLGYSTLRHANWWFDFPHRRWAVTKAISGT